MIEKTLSLFSLFQNEFIYSIALICILLLLLILIKLTSLFKSLNTQKADISNILGQIDLMSNLSEKQQQQIISQQFEFKHYIEQQFSDFKIKFIHQFNDQSEKQFTVLNEFNVKLQKTLHEHQHLFNQNQRHGVDQLVEHLNKAALAARDEQAKSLKLSSEEMAEKIKTLTESTDNRLKEISGQVEKRLAEGFEKTTKTFNDILKRLALIDDAQKKITELSSNVVSLQEVLNDKRSRGAFGEVQLNGLIRNVLPEQHFSLQHTLSNGKIADCILFLPEPTGNVVIDAKFPLESYKKMMDNALGEYDRKSAEKQFKLDIKKHINDISDKYLIENETSEGAIMFIPAEAIFAEIHAHQSDLVEYANKKRVWLTSPTTLMAILTTSRSVLKDEATRKQVHVIQEHLTYLSQDFSRFKSRFANLAKHIDQAATDVKQIHTSAEKISTRFEKIENVELSHEEVKRIEL